MKALLIISALLASSVFSFISAFAAAPTLKVDPNESRILFTATQNGAPVEGSFTRFDATIAFDPKDLATSSIKADVDIDSFTTGFQDVVTNVKQPAWFNVAVFPKATFISKKLIAKGGDLYEAEGTLTIKGKTLPLTLPFTVKEEKPGQYVAKSELTLQRTQFSVGEGEWAKTDVVKDDVKVNIVIKAAK